MRGVVLIVFARSLIGCGSVTLGTPADAGNTGDPCADVRCPPLASCVDGACVAEDPCAGMDCGAGFVCSAGSCVNEEVDEDGDGAPARSDCDDHDADVVPGSTARCSSRCGQGLSTCAEGGWTECSAPSECNCVPQATRAEPCGRCGEATRTCSADGVWESDLGACAGEGECSAGAAEVGGCPDGTACEVRARTCAFDCTWEPWGECEGNDECQAGTVDPLACGLCGTRTRLCTDTCLWGAYGDCAGEGVCTAGTVETNACGDCGTTTRTCGGTCQWPDWSACAGNGANEACYSGEAGTSGVGPCHGGTRSCQANGTWSGCAGEVVPGAEACNARDDDCNGEVDNGAPCPCPVEQHNGHAYLFCSDVTDWRSARDACIDLDYALVEVDDAQEDTWLRGRAGGSWLGLNDLMAEGQFTWDRGDSAYRNWHAGEPNDSNGTEDCTLAWWEGTWWDATCDWPSAYVCESE